MLALAVAVRVTLRLAPVALAFALALALALGPAVSASVTEFRVVADDEVLGFVAANAGAVGYVSAEAAIPESVKVIAVVD